MFSYTVTPLYYNMYAKLHKMHEWLTEMLKYEKMCEYCVNGFFGFLLILSCMNPTKVFQHSLMDIELLGFIKEKRLISIVSKNLQRYKSLNS